MPSYICDSPKCTEWAVTRVVLHSSRGEVCIRHYCGCHIQDLMSEAEHKEIPVHDLRSQMELETGVNLMPYHVSKHSCPEDRPWAVVKDSDGSVVACHETKDAAERQIRAIEASERSEPPP